MGFNVRKIGALAGGVADGLGHGVKIKNAYQDGERKQKTYDNESDAAKEVGKKFNDGLAKAHYDAQSEFGKTFANFLAPSPMEGQAQQPGVGVPSFTGAAATDMRQQPAGQFGGAAPAVAAAMAPPVTPMLTAMTQPRRIRPLAYGADTATFDEE